MIYPVDANGNEFYIWSSGQLLKNHEPHGMSLTDGQAEYQRQLNRKRKTLPQFVKQCACGQLYTNKNSDKCFTCEGKR